MADILTPKQRSHRMALIRSLNTKPELIVRRIVYKLGYRYRLYDKTLPGKPDLVFKSRKKIIFVNGCYWHRHKCRKGKRIPKTNQSYWKKKFLKNKKRDKKVINALLRKGWDIHIVWECEIIEIQKIKTALKGFLDKKPI